VLVANGSASGLHRSRAVLEGAERLLRERSVRVETHLTASLEELAATSLDFHERRVVLLGGDGTVHAAAICRSVRRSSRSSRPAGPTTSHARSGSPPT
jgi:diacylglycerol kinase family enzyme